MQHLPSNFHCLVILDAGNGVYRICITLMSMLSRTTWYRSNAVSFIENPYNRHPIARTWGWDWGCLLWAQTVLYFTAVLYYISCYIGPLFQRAPNGDCSFDFIYDVSCDKTKDSNYWQNEYYSYTCPAGMFPAMQTHIYTCVVAKSKNTHRSYRVAMQIAAD